MKKERAIGVSLLLASTVLLIGFTEGLCRVFIHKDVNETVAGFVVPDETLIWRLKPFTEGPLKTNELGFRDLPYKRDASTKILLLGDSVSWEMEYRR